MQKIYAQVKFEDILEFRREKKTIIGCSLYHNLPNELIDMLIKSYNNYINHSLGVPFLDYVGQGIRETEVLYQNLSGKYVFYINIIDEYQEAISPLYKIHPSEVTIKNCYGDKCRYEYELLERGNVWCESCFGDFDSENGNYIVLLSDEITLNQARAIPIECINDIVMRGSNIRDLEKMTKRLKEYISAETAQRVYREQQIKRIRSEEAEKIRLIKMEAENQISKLKVFDTSFTNPYYKICEYIGGAEIKIREHYEDIEKKKRSIIDEITRMEADMANITKNINEKKKLLDTL